jgi:hypothetical protein
MHHAALPGRLGEELAERLDKPQALVAYDQSNALQAPVLQIPKKLPPALLVLLRPLCHPQNLAVALLVDADRHQHTHVLHGPAPSAL